VGVLREKSKKMDLSSVVIVREATAQDALGIAQVHVDSWKTAYAGILDTDFLANLSYEKRRNLWTRIFSGLNGIPPYPVFVAFDTISSCVVGFCAGGEAREESDKIFEGELYSIYLLQKYEGFGIGRKLFQKMKDTLLERGYKNMCLWVLKENSHARRFYEKMGGVSGVEKVAPIGEKIYEEIQYVYNF